jgi:hypothetical protein
VRGWGEGGGREREKKKRGRGRKREKERKKRKEKKERKNGRAEGTEGKPHQHLTNMFNLNMFIHVFQRPVFSAARCTSHLSLPPSFPPHAEKKVHMGERLSDEDKEGIAYYLLSAREEDRFLTKADG